MINWYHWIYNAEVRKNTLNNTNYLGMYHVYIIHFHIGLGWEEHIKVWHEICDRKICSSIFMKQHIRYCINFWGRSNQYLGLNHMEVKIQKINIMIWVEEFQDLVHFTIITWFNWSGLRIWNQVICILKWIIWRLKLKITITNGIMMKYPRDSQKHRTGFRRRDPGFEVKFWRVDFPLSWWIS